MNTQQCQQPEGQGNTWMMAKQHPELSADECNQRCDGGGQRKHEQGPIRL
ncbi:hypothetical protein [Halochromatium roseum]|nr:hypothetical protein [Halochromatium roseum]